jgi:hypothetical protein
MRVSITGKRAGTPTATPSASRGDLQDIPGYLVANEALRKACVGGDLDREGACLDAQDYADSWEAAIEFDLAELPDPIDPQTGRALVQLEEIELVAAKMGALKVPGPCGTLVPAFPVIHALLPAFGKLFVQAVNAAGTNRPDDVTKATSLADDLLLYAEAADRKPPVSSAPCP